MKILTVHAPEYRLDQKPDYLSIGTKVDAVIGNGLADGEYIARAIGSSDHPGKSLEDVVAIIAGTGTDKYEAGRTDVGGFEGYDHDFQGGRLDIVNGRPVEVEEDALPTFFGDVVYRFYEFTPFDRGYSVRIDILMIYHAHALQRASYVRPEVPRVREKLEQYLFKFKDPTRKADALAAIVKILP